MYIKQNLNYLRIKQGLSLRALSSKSEISHTVFEHIEKGKTQNPGINTIMEICKMFDISIDDFVYKDLSK